MESTNSENLQMTQRTSRTIIRTRGRPRKSPSRLSPGRKSPSRRSPSRRSPARKSPSRRSPGRSPQSQTSKLATRNLKIPQVSIKRSDEPKSDVGEVKTIVETLQESEDVIESLPLQSRIRESAQVTRRSTRILSNMMKTEREQRLMTLSRNVDRAASLPIERRTIVFDFLAEQRERGLSMQRDRDLSKILNYEEEALPDSSTTTEKSKKEIELISKPQEWGGWFGALCLIFVLPTAIIVPQVACFNGVCNSTQFRVPTKLNSYLDLRAIALYPGFLGSLALFSLIPIGRTIDGQQSKTGRLQYRMNGIISALLTVVALGIAEYYSYGINEFILNSTLQLSVAGWILATIIAIGLYIKAGRVSVAALNIYGSTHNVIYDFWQGREVNPRIARLDVKLLFLRANVIGTLILNSAIVTKYLHDVDLLDFMNLNYTILLVCSLQIMYCLDNLVFESGNLTTFKVLYDGTGYMVCVANLLYPFLMTLGARFLLYHNIQQSPYVLVLTALFFFIGYTVYRRSNSQKNEFRTNPFNPALSHFVTISTSRGKKIISSGLWGHVRHPNYLGDIIMQWSLACVAMDKDFLPYYSALFCTLVLMYRAIRDDRRCKNRYGAAWEQYCLRVKSFILKYVF